MNSNKSIAVSHITVNTDASFKEGIGAYAFYIICNHFKIQKAGYFKGKVKDSHSSEIMAIGNALYTTLKQNEISRCGLLIINTDSTTAIKWIDSGKTKQSKIVKGIMTKLRKKFGCEFEFRHVKAYSGKRDSRSFVNEWCDKESKKYRVIRENQLK